MKTTHKKIVIHIESKVVSIRFSWIRVKLFVMFIQPNLVYVFLFYFFSKTKVNSMNKRNKKSLLSEIGDVMKGKRGEYFITIPDI